MKKASPRERSFSSGSQQKAEASNETADGDEGRARASTLPNELEHVPSTGSEESSEDEELRAAKAMALAIQNNPNLTPDEIRALVAAQGNSADVKSNNAPLIPGRLTNLFGQQQQQQPVEDKGKKSNRPFPRFQGFLHSSRNVTAPAAAPVAAAAPASTASTTTAATTTTTTAIVEDHSESASSEAPHGLRLPFRHSNKGMRSPPVSPAGNNNNSEGIVTVNSTESAMLAPDLELSTSSLRQQPVRLSTIAWKRRGGMGKFSGSAWERRRIELQGTKLVYYKEEEEGGLSERNNNSDSVSQIPAPEDGKEEGVVVVNNKRTNWFEQAAQTWNKDDPTTPRGHIDLKKESATVHAAYGHSGAPSPFALSIKVRGETKWKICFDFHPEHMAWLAAITDVVVQTSVDTYNANLLRASDPSNHTEGTFFPPPVVQEPPSTENGEKQATTAAAATSAAHRLWMTEKYVIRSLATNEQDVDSSHDEDDDVAAADTVLARGSGTVGNHAMDSEVTAARDANARLIAKDKASKNWVIPQPKLWYAAVVLNSGLAYARASSTSMGGFWYAVAAANLGLFFCTVKEPDWKAILQQVKAPQMVMASPGTKTKATKGKRTASGAKGSSSAAAAPDVYIPLAGVSSVRIKETTDPPTNSKGQIFAGWRAPSGESMMVRSHGYMSTKTKIPSPGELFELAAVDVFESPSRYPDMGPRVKLPKVAFQDTGPKTWRTPDIFIISIALPTDPPKLGRTSSDGGGYTITMYFVMKQTTRDILRRVTADGYDPSAEKAPEDVQKSQVNAVRLLEEWCRRAPTDPKFQSRFKIVPNAHNLKEIGMPGWISKYNGKPFLIKRPGETGFLFSHPELSCMEFDVSLHPFPYLAKQAICFMKDSYFKKVLVSFGFVIEGRADDELPECVIGVMQLCYPDPIHAIQADEFFRGEANRATD